MIYIVDNYSLQLVDLFTSKQNQGGTIFWQMVVGERSCKMVRMGYTSLGAFLIP